MAEPVFGPGVRYEGSLLLQLSSDDLYLIRQTQAWMERAVEIGVHPTVEPDSAATPIRTYDIAGIPPMGHGLIHYSLEEGETSKGLVTFPGNGTTLFEKPSPKAQADLETRMAERRFRGDIFSRTVGYTAVHGVLGDVYVQVSHLRQQPSSAPAPPEIIHFAKITPSPGDIYNTLATLRTCNDTVSWETGGPNTLALTEVVELLQQAQPAGTPQPPSAPAKPAQDSV